MQYFGAFLICLIIVTTILTVDCLECYVCERQDDNNEKCTQTIQTCEYGKDVCLTEVSWGSTPYWSQGALKQYYVSKRCSTQDNCEKYRRANMPTCTHIWYQDWKCSECCKGDRCNYYIISGNQRLSITTSLVFTTFILNVIYNI